MNIVRTDIRNDDFLTLIGKLNTELKERYGELQAKFDAHNKIDLIPTAVVGYIGGAPDCLWLL